MNYQTLLNKSALILKKNSIKSPVLDCEILLSYALGFTREEVLLNLTNKLKISELIKFNTNFKKRKKMEPMAYILGKKEFWKSNFVVNKKVLIPRPDSEILVEESLSLLKKEKYYNILDIGIGSGCILISILKDRKKCVGTGIDISHEALRVAKINAKIQNLENRIKFIHSDIDKFLGSKYDMVVSNPPYISSSNVNGLSEDIKFYEPKLALNGGPDGYSKIKKVIKKSSKLLKNRGKLILEIGFNQLTGTIKILQENGFYINKYSKDLAGKIRCVISTKL